MGYTVAFDKEGKTEASYMQAAEQFGIPTAFVVDKSGRIAWIGHPADSLEEVLTEIFAGKYDIEAAKKWFDLESRFTEAYQGEDYEGAVKVTDEMIALKPNDTAGWVRKIGMLDGPLDKQEAARDVAQKAAAALNGNAKGLAALSGMLIQLDGFDEVFQAAMKRAVELAPEDADVRSAEYAVLAKMDKQDEALNVAQKVIELIKDEPAELGRFARQLSKPDPKERCNDLALRAVELAIAAEPDEPAHLQTKFQIIAYCKQDEAAAAKVGRYLIEKASGDANMLNSFAWALLTEPGLMGKYNELALAASERMHEVSGGENWSYLDTHALAKFENGKVEEAIELEKKAIALCENEGAKPSLKAALERFEAGKKSE
jgi:tetratricopeptide (TPR) repeat protein